MHSFNDEDVIDRTLRALLNQTHPVDQILLVDNGSTDGTLTRPFPEQVTVIRHGNNRGTSGAVITGFQYALTKGYDWIWVLDADSAPRPDALEKLLAFLCLLPDKERSRVQALSSQPVEGSITNHAITFTATGYEPARWRADVDAYGCDAVIWSGALFNVEVIRQIGLPSADYVLDWAEFEYGYQGMRRGYKTYVVRSSVLEHNIGIRSPSHLRTFRIGPVRLRITEMPPIRLYYLVRNSIFFWCYEFVKPSYWAYVSVWGILSWIPKYVIKLLVLRRREELVACLRGVRDGILGKMHRRY